MEKILLRHMGRIAILFGLIVFFTWLIPLFNNPVWGLIRSITGLEEIKGIISTQYMFTTIGAIFVFWYGYKRYERDKELEILNSVKFDISNYNEMVIDWHTKRILYEKKYIKEYIWEVIEKKYILDYQTLISVRDFSENNHNDYRQVALDITKIKSYKSTQEYFNNIYISQLKWIGSQIKMYKKLGQKDEEGVMLYDLIRITEWIELYDKDATQYLEIK